MEHLKTIIELAKEQQRTECVIERINFSEPMPKRRRNAQVEYDARIQTHLSQKSEMSIESFLVPIEKSGEETPECHHCEDHLEDTVEHTVAVCPAWVEHRRVLSDMVGDDDVSRPALVQTMVRRETGKRTSSRPSRCVGHSGRRGSSDDLRPPIETIHLAD
uniref:SFRICE_024114 n=1 Tax=Spodoptera frugiperda TaxID=7108 RepID=A0A2H1VJW9_SPOFR